MFHQHLIVLETCNWKQSLWFSQKPFLQRVEKTHLLAVSNQRWLRTIKRHGCQPPSCILIFVQVHVHVHAHERQETTTAPKLLFHVTYPVFVWLSRDTRGWAPLCFFSCMPIDFQLY